MANIYLHWMKEISERRNIYIDLDLNKDIIYWQNSNPFSVLIIMLLSMTL